MKSEFLEYYEELFSGSYQRLFRTLQVKLNAMKHCQERLHEIVDEKKDQINSKLESQVHLMMSSKKGFKSTYYNKEIDYELSVIDLNDID